MRYDIKVTFYFDVLADNRDSASDQAWAVIREMRDNGADMNDISWSVEG